MRPEALVTRSGRGGRPKAVEIEQRNRDILRAAGETFLRSGFDGTSMDAVADAAHISKRTLYTRYPDKTVLFDAVLRDLIARWLTPIGRFQSEHGELRDTLLALARYLMTAALTPQSVNVHRIILSEAQRRPEFGKLANEAGRKPALQAVVSILREHRFELRPINLEMAAEQFFALAVDSSLRLAALGIRIEATQIEERVCSSVDLFLEGARCSPSRGPQTV
jgi:AcrR family transcriptional regulator